MNRHQYIDGASFGTTFPHLFFHTFPELIPKKYSDRYIPKIFGFRVHECVKVMGKTPPALLNEGDTKMDTEN